MHVPQRMAAAASFTLIKVACGYTVICRMTVAWLLSNECEINAKQKVLLFTVSPSLFNFLLPFTVQPVSESNSESAEYRAGVLPTGLHSMVYNLQLLKNILCTNLMSESFIWNSLYVQYTAPLGLCSNKVNTRVCSSNTVTSNARPNLKLLPVFPKTLTEAPVGGRHPCCFYRGRAVMQQHPADRSCTVLRGAKSSVAFAHSIFLCQSADWVVTN
jgi:hypothetical protein